MNEEEVNQKKLELIMTLTSALPILRAGLGMSQENIAKCIGVSRQTYCAIENQTRTMSWTIFMALITVFDMNGSTSVILDQIPDFIQSIRALIQKDCF